MLDGGAGFVSAAVQPDHDGAFCVVAARRPEIQVQTVLIHRPVAVRHVKLSVGSRKGKKRADKAEAARVKHVRPSLHRLRRMETSGLRIGNSLENADIVPDVALYLSFRGLHHGCFRVTSENGSHNDFPPFSVALNALRTFTDSLYKVYQAVLFFIIYRKDGGCKMERRLRPPDMKNGVAQFWAALRKKDGNFWGKPPKRIRNVWIFCEFTVKKHKNIIET